MISVNGVGVFDGTIISTPIVVNSNDTVTIKVYKSAYSIGEFKIIGSTI